MTQHKLLSGHCTPAHSPSLAPLAGRVGASITGGGDRAAVCAAAAGRTARRRLDRHHVAVCRLRAGAAADQRAVLGFLVATGIQHRGPGTKAVAAAAFQLVLFLYLFTSAL